MLFRSITLDDSGTNVTSTTFSASLNPLGGDDGSPYLFKYLGYNADNSKTSNTAFTGTPAYTHLNFKNLQTSILATGSLAGYPANDPVANRSW